MNLIELHILHSFPVTCLNRDDAGAPKTAFFGGVQRARVSSQCWKRAIRFLAKELAGQNGESHFGGIRSHYLAAEMEHRLRNLGLPEEKAKEGATAIAEHLGKRDSKVEGIVKTSVALFLSPKELDAICQAAAKQYEKDGEIKPSKGNLKKQLQEAQPDDIADISIFGRMVASEHSLMVEGAGLFSHAISTHEAGVDIDFFSAVDELKPEESEGAGHIGTLEFSSACYYRYVGLNWDLLSDDNHLGTMPVDARRKVTEIFLRAAVQAVPSARKNSMFGHNPPEYVLGVTRQGHPLSLANAFEQPVRSRNGYVTPSRDRLVEHYKHLGKVYGLGEQARAEIPDTDINQFATQLLEALPNG